MKKLFSIVIPTYNGEETIGKLLDKLSILIKSYPHELIIIDSQSSDKTISIAKKYKDKFEDFKIIGIKKKNFNHGDTRNLGVKASRGEFVCFFTQDALPKDKRFFEYYIEDFQIDKRVAVVFGKNFAYPKTPIIQKIESDCRWEEIDRYCNKKGVFVQRLDRQFLPYVPKNYLLWYFSSNTSSCYRRSFLIKHPFPKTDYGEDMMIGKMIIKNGFFKVYDTRCFVIHSHSYNLREYYIRQRSSLILRFNKVGLGEKVNLYCKIKKIFQTDVNILEKIYYLSLLYFYYMIKLVIWIEIKIKSLFLGKNFYKNE